MRCARTALWKRPLVAREVSSATSPAAPTSSIGHAAKLRPAIAVRYSQLMGTPPSPGTRTRTLNAAFR